MANDNRRLSQIEQDDLRRRGIALVKAGRSQADVARELHVRPATICSWIRRGSFWSIRNGKSRKRGLKSNDHVALNERKSRRIQEAIHQGEPLHYGLRHPVWTPRAVQDYVSKRFGFRVSIPTVYKYLRRWNLVPPNTRYGGGGRAVIALFKSVQTDACEAGAAIWFQCQRQLDDGSLPRVLFAARSRGECAFSIHTDPLTPMVYLDFIQRICEHEGRMVYLLLDGHDIHRKNSIKHWANSHPHRLRISYCDGADVDAYKTKT